MPWKLIKKYNLTLGFLKNKQTTRNLLIKIKMNRNNIDIFYSENYCNNLYINDDFI